MFFRNKQKSQTPEWPPPVRRPSIEIYFLDEVDDYIDDANTFMYLQFVPREGEEIQLSGDFRRRGCFIVERVVYSLVCDERHNGWVRSDLLEVYAFIYVREKDAAQESQATSAPAHAHEQD